MLPDKIVIVKANRKGRTVEVWIRYLFDNGDAGMSPGAARAPALNVVVLPLFDKDEIPAVDQLRGLEITNDQMREWETTHCDSFNAAAYLRSLVSSN